MDFASITISLVSVFGVFNYFWWKRQQSHLEQIQNFHKYSLRYQDLYAELVAKTDVTAAFEKDNAVHRSLAIKFFMLFSEEYYLAEEAKHIRNDVWDIWKSGIQTSMRYQFFQGAWDFAKSQADLSGNFALLMEGARKQNRDQISEAA